MVAPLSVTLHAGGLYLPVTLLSRAVVTLLAAPGAGFRNRPLPSPQPFAAPSLLFARLFSSPPSLSSPSAAPSIPWSCWLGVGWGSPLAPSRKEPSVLTLTVGGGSRAFPELRRRRPPAQEPHRCLKTETNRLVYGLTQNPPWKLPENTRGGVGLGCELLWPGVRAVKFLSICCLSVKWK